MTSLLITCEHGGNRVPAKYRTAFLNATAALDTHRGWDPGALPLARRFAKHFGVQLQFSEISRLLVDLNRSVGHPRLFSEWSRALPADDRRQILGQYYWPHRNAVIHELSQLMRRKNRVLHVSVHSFTPVLDGRVRRADVGLLYDPSRLWERSCCDEWKRELGLREPQLCVLRNSPYRGVSDGFTTALRRDFPDAVYAGVELEINQRLLNDRRAWRRIQASLCESLDAIVGRDDR